MAVLAIMHAAGMTRENYESLRPIVRWETEHPAGALFHTSAFDEQGGLRVVDVWESAEAMQSFFESRLKPALEQLGVTGPSVDIYPVHNLNAYPGLSEYHVEPLTTVAEQ